MDSETRDVLNREAKPPTWQALAESAGADQSELAQWLYEGKQKQRGKIAQFEADPDWRAWADRLGAFPKALVKK